MKITWLENLEKQGHISEQAKALIYQDCEELVAGDLHKVAEGAYTMSAEMQSTIGMLPVVLPAVQLAGMGYSALKGLVETPLTISKVNKNRLAIDKDPLFNKTETDLSKAHARFNEIADLAPTVASDYGTAQKLISKRLHSGMTETDSISLMHLQKAYRDKSPESQSKLSNKVTQAHMKGTGKKLETSLKKKAEALATVCGIVKEAVDPKTLKQIGWMFGAPLVGGFGLGAFQHGKAKRSEAKLKTDLSNTLSKVMKSKDEAGEVFRADPSKAKEAFETLAHFAPHMALQSTAAKSFMTNLMSAGLEHGATPEVIKTLTDVQKNVATAQSNHFEEGFRSGAKGMGLANLGGMTGDVGESLNKTLGGNLGVQYSDKGNVIG